MASLNSKQMCARMGIRGWGHLVLFLLLGFSVRNAQAVDCAQVMTGSVSGAFVQLPPPGSVTNGPWEYLTSVTGIPQTTRRGYLQDRYYRRLRSVVGEHSRRHAAHYHSGGHD